MTTLPQGLGPLRDLSRCLLPLLGLALSAEPASATSVDLIWTGTSGAGVVGSSAIEVSAAQPETLTLELVLDVDSLGLSLLSVSVRFDRDLRDELNLLSTETPSWSNPEGPGSFTGVGFASSRESDASAEGEIRSLGGFAPGLGPQNTTLSFARLVFATNPSNLTNDGSDVFSLFGSPDDFALIGNGLFRIDPAFGSAAVNVIPEPLPLGLLGLGIAVLGLAARSRTRAR